jgi:hypothetical protein
MRVRADIIAHRQLSLQGGRDHLLDADKVDDARTKLLDLKHLGRMFALGKEKAEVVRSNCAGCANFLRS